MTLPPSPLDGAAPGAPTSPYGGLVVDGYASPGHLPAAPLGVAAARKARRRGRRPVRGHLPAGQSVARGAFVTGLTGAVLVAAGTRGGSVDMTVPAPVLSELAPAPTAPPSTVPVVEYPAPPTVQPTLEVAGGAWQLVWALLPEDPAANAGLWPGTPWPGNPGRSLIGVQADLSGVQPGDGLTVDGRVWTVFEVRQVAPEDWESLAEQPVSAAEVAVYELGDRPVRAAALARQGVGR